jgi:hypothetical protein
MWTDPHSLQVNPRARRLTSPKHIPSAQCGEDGELQSERKVELKTYRSDQSFKPGGVDISRKPDIKQIVYYLCLTPVSSDAAFQVPAQLG